MEQAHDTGHTTATPCVCVRTHATPGILHNPGIPAPYSLHSQPTTAPSPQLLSDLRRKQRELADSQELAAAREDRLQKDIAQLSEASRGLG